MARVKTVVASRKQKRKIFKRVKGFWGGKHRLYRSAKESMMRALQFAYRDRRRRKRDFRRLWIIRINAACRLNGLPYKTFIAGLKAANVIINRKLLADLAVKDPIAFAKLVEQAKAAIQSPTN
ncbi:MAG: 50S ribosomal protein L20 [Candidatus Edwardsbacteria bacterium]